MYLFATWHSTGAMYVSVCLANVDTGEPWHPHSLLSLFFLLCQQYTVELQWLEHLWDHEN